MSSGPTVKILVLLAIYIHTLCLCADSPEPLLLNNVTSTKTSYTLNQIFDTMVGITSQNQLTVMCTTHCERRLISIMYQKDKEA